jgi:hypothetical protein
MKGNNRYKYEYLGYVDSADERASWLGTKKLEFKRLQIDAADATALVARRASGLTDSNNSDSSNTSRSSSGNASSGSMMRNY